MALYTYLSSLLHVLRGRVNERGGSNSIELLLIIAGVIVVAGIVVVAITAYVRSHLPN